MAEAAGELVNPDDTGGSAVGSWWVHNPAAAGDLQGLDHAGANVPWTYLTAHLGVDGQFVQVNRPTGALSAVQVNSFCQAQHWVPCCNP